MEHSRPFFVFVWNCVCLFCLFVFCLVMVYDVWQQYCFFLIFCLHLAFSSIQIEKCFGNCLKRAAKKVRSTTLDWFDLGGRYTYIRVHKNICNQLHTRVKTFWISKGTFEIATKVFKLSGLVISEKKREMKMKKSLFFNTQHVTNSTLVCPVKIEYVKKLIFLA